MQITDVRVRKVTKEGKLKAVVSITIDNEFVVHDIKVIEGEKGLFIAMPSKKALDGEYRVKRYRKYPRQHLEDLRTGKKEALPKDDDGCTGSNAVFGVITHIINDARSGEFDDCPVM